MKDPALKSRRYVLLDRDGTINVDRHYLRRAEDLELLPGAAAGLRALQDMGLGLIVVTNQSGIGRGYFSEDDLAAIHARLHALLAAEGVHLEGIYICPHLPADNCPCRKPRRGLVDQAIADLHFDPRESFVLGDQPCDMELSAAIGATGIQVTSTLPANSPPQTEFSRREEQPTEVVSRGSGLVPVPWHATDLVAAAKRVGEILHARDNLSPLGGVLHPAARPALLSESRS